MKSDSGIVSASEGRNPRSGAVGAIVGSAFSEHVPESWELQAIAVETPWGSVVLHAYRRTERSAFLLFRHGNPHRFLPHQIPYRAHAWALRAAGCEALLCTSSVGVLCPDLPLFTLMAVGDILMPDNRLPHGAACTMFSSPTPGQGHLVLKEGLICRRLQSSLGASLGKAGIRREGPVTFAYVGGPRTKTAAENRYWVAAGADVNSMTLAPELVLANELGIPTAAVVVGHKYSLPSAGEPAGRGRAGRVEPEPPPGATTDIEGSLEESRRALVSAVERFLEDVEPAAVGNELYRFSEPGIGGADR